LTQNIQQRNIGSKLKLLIVNVPVVDALYAPSAEALFRPTGRLVRLAPDIAGRALINFPASIPVLK
jgi:hypothetical protein